MNEKLKERMISAISKCRSLGTFRMLDMMEFEGYSRREARDMLQNLIEEGYIVVEWNRTMKISGSL